MGDHMDIRRLLPVAPRRIIGPWCFLDHFGPASFDDPARGMRVGPHPHIGLQTVTWLLDGEVLHRDSLGSLQMIRPGQLNVMTAGRGISHTEETPTEHSTRLHGLQLWAATPDADRHGEPAFEHLASVPERAWEGARIAVVAGTWQGARNPARFFSPLVALDIHALTPLEARLPLDPTFEHGLVAVQGRPAVDSAPLEDGELAWVGTGCDGVPLRMAAGDRLFLVGGAPLGERVLLWWNFVGRSAEELLEARTDWEAGRRFGHVTGWDGPPLAAPGWVPVR
jgi:redox-sensitive bicupin YhaK (pirin superfamily)